MQNRNRFKESNKYFIQYIYQGNIYLEEVFGAKAAVAKYREFKKNYGTNVCLVKVVVDYGEEI